MEPLQMSVLFFERRLSLKYSVTRFPRFVVELEPDFQLKSGEGKLVKRLELSFYVGQETVRPEETAGNSAGLRASLVRHSYHFNLECTNAVFDPSWDVKVMIHSTLWTNYIDCGWADAKRFSQPVTFFDDQFYQCGDKLYLDFKIIILKPANDKSQLPLDFSHLFLNERHSDFAIVCVDDASPESESQRRIPVHKALLSGASPYFRGLLDSTNAETCSGRVVLPIGFKALREVLHFVYCGELSASVDENIVDVVGVADYFMMDRLKQVLVQRTCRLWSPANVGDMFEKACELEVGELARLAFAYAKRELPREQQAEVFDRICRRFPAQFARVTAGL